MRSYIKALIFDLDGTLADTVPAIAEAVNMTMDRFGFPRRSEDEIRSFIGQGPRHLITLALPNNSGVENPELVDLALGVYNDMYAKTYMHTDKLYDGMRDALIMLSKYYKIAVLSNKQDEYVRSLVKQLIPPGICSAARGTVDGIPAKPDPSAAIEIAEKLGVNPQECVLVGDSDVDILTASNARMDILSVSWGYVSKTKLIFKGAQEILNSPDELIEYFY